MTLPTEWGLQANIGTIRRGIRSVPCHELAILLYNTSLPQPPPLSADNPSSHLGFFAIYICENITRKSL